MRADWTACGACTSGSTAHRRGATRRASGGAATTSAPTKARARAEAEGTLLSPIERAMTDHQIVSHDDWIARGRFLANEKEFTRLREELSGERELPWECVKKEYVFEGENGGETLAHLFGRRSQLLAYHLLDAPDLDILCKNCFLWAENFHGSIPHLHERG